jgi:hypothetical protein
LSPTCKVLVLVKGIKKESLIMTGIFNSESVTIFPPTVETKFSKSKSLFKLLSSL